MKGFPASSARRPFIRGRLSRSLLTEPPAFGAEDSSQALSAGTEGSVGGPLQQLKMPGKMAVIIGVSNVLWMVLAACKFSPICCECLPSLSARVLSSVTFVTFVLGHLHCGETSLNLTCDVLFIECCCVSLFGQSWHCKLMFFWRPFSQ